MLDRYIVENHGGIDSTLKILFENQISRGLYSRRDKKLSRRVMEYSPVENFGRIRKRSGGFVFRNYSNFSSILYAIRNREISRISKSDKKNEGNSTFLSFFLSFFRDIARLSVPYYSEPRAPRNVRTRRLRRSLPSLLFYRLLTEP